jgi:hypothetical protein
MTDAKAGKPTKYQYQKSIPGGKMDAVFVNQTDTGGALVKRPIVVLGDAAEGGLYITKADFQAQIVCLGKILEELQKMNEHLNQITEYES